MRCCILLSYAFAPLIPLRRFTISTDITTIDAIQSAARLGILINNLRDMRQGHLTQLVLVVQLVANLIPEPALGQIILCQLQKLFEGD